MEFKYYFNSENGEANEHKRRLYERESVQSQHNVPYDAS